MMPRVRLELEGARELEAALRGLPTAAMKRGVIQRAFQKSGAPIVAAANALLPLGAQRVGIKVEIRAKLSRRQRRRPPSPHVIEMFLGVGPSRLAHLFEFGTAQRYTTGRAKASGGYSYGSGQQRRGRMEATPYLRPAWDGGSRAMFVEFGRLLWKEIEAAAKRYAVRQARLLRKSGARG